MKRMIGSGDKIGLTCLAFLLSFSTYGYQANLTNDSLAFGHSVSSTKISSVHSHIKVASWNHISGADQEFSNLSQESSAYEISYRQVFAEHGESLEINTVLVKKIINWTRQHSNGIKLIFSDKAPTIGQLDKLIFELRIDYNRLTLPSNVRIFEPYELGANKAEAAKGLLSDTGYLNFTLFGRFHDDQQIATILATKIVAMPTLADHGYWFTLELKVADFHYYWQQAWQETPVNREEVKQKEILGLLITAESPNTKTLRNYLVSDLPVGFEEHFIEIPISIRTSAQLYFNDDL